MEQPDTIEIEVAGHIRPFLRVYTGVSLCGEISDGIAMEHVGRRGGRVEGCWVVSFADLERIYLEARAFRAREAA